MGGAKAMMMESEARGWDAPDAFVCAECVDDKFLEELILSEASEKKCDYCGRKSKKLIAAPVEAIMPAIAETLFAYFAEPSSAGLPRDDGEWVGGESITDTGDALESIPLRCNDKLFEDVSDAFHNTAWFPCARGYWVDIPENEELQSVWRAFVEEVKHRSRFFFSKKPKDSELSGGERFSPAELLEDIGSFVRDLGLAQPLAQAKKLYRIRCHDKNLTVATFSQIGPPPSELASAGRMNPAGISYLYLAFDEKTAEAEVAEKATSYGSIGSFETTSELLVLDLSVLPECPSVFDGDRRTDRERLIFLEHFVQEISAPIEKDGREHIEYVPSQVVSEYFAQLFDAGDGKRLNGIIYPSAAREGGTNLVLFPSPEYSFEWEDFVKLMTVSQIQVGARKRG